MSEIKNTIIYEGDNTGVTVELTEENIFIVKHGLKEMCPTKTKRARWFLPKDTSAGWPRVAKLQNNYLDFMPEFNANPEGTIRKVLKNEVTAFIGAVSVVFGFIMFVVVPQQKTSTDIALIQASIKKIEENHLTHLQTYAEEIKEIKNEESEEKKIQTELMKKLIEVDTKLTEHEKNTK